ncbi:MAG TPA: hypothetical protein VL137_01005, partial [Polyangiaceae bacterium]|nr:hypothetical protein [Polyangiaceae bacterium]
MSPSRPTSSPLASTTTQHRRPGRIVGVTLLGLIFGLSSCDEHSQQQTQRETIPAPKAETKPPPSAPAATAASNPAGGAAGTTGVAGIAGAANAGPVPSIPSFEEELKPIEHSGQYFAA